MAATSFALGDEFVGRIAGAARYGTVIYAAVEAQGSEEVFGVVVIAERRNGILFTKCISEVELPDQVGCPARILNLLTPTSNESAAKWRSRCRARLARRVAAKS
jgi:hypothetical protein